MNVVAITCHPDDMELHCAGTLLRCKERGDNVTVCHVANGNLGHVVIEPDELREIRINEAKKSCELAGFKVVTCDRGDLRVYEDDHALIEELVRVLREAKADLIITHDPNDYMMDHNSVAKAVFNASFAASVPHYSPELGEAIGNCPLYYMATSGAINYTPTEYVDVTSVFETKEKMLAFHESQVVWLKDHDNIDVIEENRAIARIFGIHSGVKYAEGFRPCLADGKLRTWRMLP